MEEEKTVELVIQDILLDKFGIENEDYTNDSHLTYDVGLDSLDFVELIMEVEAHYDISIPDTRFDGNFDMKLGSFITVVKEYTNNQA